MAERTRCEICDRNFKDSSGLEQHNAAVHSSQEAKKANSMNFKKLRNWGIFIVIIVVIGLLIYLPLKNVKNLPPTDIQGHVEENPASHVLKEPMPLAIQKHMLEHADGTGPPGIIINYNCEDYDCEPGLIENLEAFAERHPVNVYVAPFKGMDAKIVLTKLNRIEVMEEYDEARITSFIGGNPINNNIEEVP